MNFELQISLKTHNERDRSAALATEEPRIQPDVGSQTNFSPGLLTALLLSQMMEHIIKLLT